MSGISKNIIIVTTPMSIIIMLMTIYINCSDNYKLSKENQSIINICKYYKHSHSNEELLSIEKYALEKKLTSKQLRDYILSIDTVELNKYKSYLIKTEKTYTDSLENLGNNSTFKDSSRIISTMLEINSHIIIPYQSLEEEILALKMWK